MTENFKGIGEMKNVFDLTKKRTELQSKYNEVGNRIWRLKRERLSISSHINTVEKKIVEILRKATGMKFVKAITGDEDGK